MAKTKKASSQASWALLTEGVANSRVQIHKLRLLMERAQAIVEMSEKRDHIYRVAGDIIVGMPELIRAMEEQLDTTSYALSKMGQEFLRGQIPLENRHYVDDAIQSVPGFAPGVIRAGGYRTEDLGGTSTYRDVDNHPSKNLPQDSGSGGGPRNPSSAPHRQQALPKRKTEAPKGTRSKAKPDQKNPPSRPVHNVPGESGSRPDGKSVHQDAVRTRSTPGEQYGTPYIDGGHGNLRRRTMTADLGYMHKEELRKDSPLPRKEKRSLPNGEGVPDGGDYPEDENRTWLGERERKDRKQPAMDMPDYQVHDAPGSAKVIPDNRDFVNKKAHRRIVRAMLMRDIVQKTHQKILNKSKAISPKLSSHDKESNIYTYTVPGSKKDYEVKVRFAGSEKDVHVSCTCDFWQYQGPEHWAKVGGYLLGDPRGTATKPDKKDPKGENQICKHVASVFKMLKK